MGLERETVRALSRTHPPPVLSRRVDAEATLEELRRETGSEKHRSYLADLSSLGEVRGLAERVLSDQGRLDMLVNNAGVIVREREVSRDGN